jgi:hypothetical protein
MTAPTISLRVAIRKAQEARTLPADMRFVRVLHELELAANLPHTTPPGRPEVRPFFPNHYVPFGKHHQLLSKDMNPYCNPGNWTAIYHNNLWATNDQGYGEASDPRANFVTGEDLTSPLPRVEALTCGGNVLRVIGERVVMSAGVPVPSYIIETLDWTAPAPSLEWIEARPWLITTAVNMGKDGTPRRFEMGSQPNGFIPGVRHPLLADPRRYNGTTEAAITIPKWRVTPWDSPDVPDPYKAYL